MSKKGKFKTEHRKNLEIESSSIKGKNISFSEQIVNISNNKVVKWISLALLLISVWAYYPTSGDDYDIWWHLKYGEHFVKNLTWNIDHTQFSWTPTISDWTYNTWIGSSILYIFYWIASIPGLYILQWLIFVIIFALYKYYIKSIGDNFDINHITGLILVAIVLNLTAIFIKPELFTTLFFAITVFIYFYIKSSSKNLFFIYPILFLIWVNTHGGFIVGLFFISLTFCGEVFNSFFLKKSCLTKKLLIQFAIYFAIAYIAILINPHGITYHLNILKFLLAEETWSHSATIIAYFNLWKFVFPKVYAFRFINTVWSMLLLAILFLAVSVYGYRKNRHFDVTVVILNIVFFYIGMDKGRASIFFPLICLFSIFYTLKRGDAIFIKRKIAPIALLLFTFWSGNIIYHTVFYLDHRSWFGTNINELVPLKEVDFIKKNKLPGPVFNTYKIGGYMIWSMYPDYKVFIDSRDSIYPREVYNDWIGVNEKLKDPEGLKMFTSKYPFKTALIDLTETYIIFWLLRTPDWKLAFFDKVAAVIVHKSVYDSFSPELLAIELGPKRFENVKDPKQLEKLFDLAVNLNINPNYTREILNIFKRNVTNLYRLKEGKIRGMEKLLSIKESQIQQEQKVGEKGKQ